MSWIGIVILFAVVFPMMSRHGWGGRERHGPRNSERMEALEAELDARLDEIRMLESRVAELESRMDFSERMLGRVDG